MITSGNDAHHNRGAVDALFAVMIKVKKGDKRNGQDRERNSAAGLLRIVKKTAVSYRYFKPVFYMIVIPFSFEPALFEL